MAKSTTPYKPRGVFSIRPPASMTRKIDRMAKEARRTRTQQVNVLLEIALATIDGQKTVPATS